MARKVLQKFRHAAWRYEIQNNEGIPPYGTFNFGVEIDADDGAGTEEMPNNLARFADVSDDIVLRMSKKRKRTIQPILPSRFFDRIAVMQESTSPAVNK